MFTSITVISELFPFFFKFKFISWCDAIIIVTPSKTMRKTFETEISYYAKIKKNSSDTPVVFLGTDDTNIEMLKQYCEKYCNLKVDNKLDLNEIIVSNAENAFKDGNLRSCLNKIYFHYLIVSYIEIKFVESYLKHVKKVKKEI